MPEQTDAAVEHHARMRIVDDLIQFHCCTESDHPFDMLWGAPGGTRPNDASDARHVYQLVADHLTHGRGGDEDAKELREYADTHFDGNARMSIHLLADMLDHVELTVRRR